MRDTEAGAAARLWWMLCGVATSPWPAPQESSPPCLHLRFQMLLLRKGPVLHRSSAYPSAGGTRLLPVRSRQRPQTNALQQPAGFNKGNYIAFLLEPMDVFKQQLHRHEKLCCLSLLSRHQNCTQEAACLVLAFSHLPLLVRAQSTRAVSWGPHQAATVLCNRRLPNRTQSDPFWLLPVPRGLQVSLVLPSASGLMHKDESVMLQSNRHRCLMKHCRGSRYRIHLMCP